LSTNTILATTPLVSTNYLLRATGTTIGNSLIWDNGTNVGIGNTNTTYKLDVSGTGRFSSNVNIDGEYLTIGGATNNAVINNIASFRFNLDCDNTGTGESFTVGHNQTIINDSNVLFRVQDNGNVAIGTISPNIGGYGGNGRVLTIQGVSGSYGILELTSNSANADGSAIGRLDFGSDGQAANYKAISSIASFLSGSTSTKFGADLRFYTRADNAGTGDPVERMRITSAGNVGIGTSSPAAKLDVVTTASVTAIFTRDLATDVSLRILSDNDGSILDTQGVYNLRFQTNDVERMRITSGGNVLIGDTTTTNYRLFISTPDSGTSNWGIGIFNSAGSTLLRVRNDGAFLTGTATLSPYNNTTGGVANVVVSSDGSLLRSNPSSQRFKDNIVDWNGNGLETILALKPRTFTYKSDYYKHPELNFLGLIAEEVAEVSEYLADFENEDRTGLVENVRYANIVVPLIKAVQELSKQNEELSNRLIKLESK
jgi:hypothetical protein